METVEPRVIKLKPHQDGFAFSDAQFPALGGGWGNGKTLALCLAAYLRCEESPNNLFLIGRKQYTDLRDSTLADFLDMFGSRGHWEKSTYTFILPNRSRILFRHVDQLQSLTNLNLGGFALDQAEEISEDSFMFLRGRLRRRDVKRRQGFMTFNMEGHNWIWKLFKNEKTRLPGTALWEATTFDNADNLPPEYLKQLETLPEMVKKRYVYGSWDAFEGQVFDEFDEAIHVIPPFLIPESSFRFEGMDHGYTNPTSVHWYASDYDGNVFSYDEHYERKQLIEHHAQVIHSRRKHSLFGGDNQTIQATYIDPATRAENMEYKGQLTSVLKLYQRFGINAIPAANDVASGINLIKQYLTIDSERIHPVTGRKGAPMLYFFKNCVEQIEEVRNYAWKKLKPTEIATKNAPEQPVKANDHSVDDLKYVLLSHFGSPEKPKNDKPKNIGELVQRDLERIGQREQDEEFSFVIE